MEACMMLTTSHDPFGENGEESEDFDGCHY